MAVSEKIGASKRRASLSVFSLGIAAMVLAGCGGPLADIFDGTKFSPSSMGVSASPRVTSSRNVPKGGGRYQVGQPYTVAGQRFVPREQPDLDQTGRASWYGPAFHGRLTANGEIFDQYHLSGAHPTLPLPSYVRVTNLDNGASAVVRINDRGPFSNNRVIDLSRRTAEVLGFKQQGLGNVRVQYVGPAPLNGDDTRFLVASINRLTPMERDGTTRMAYQETQVAQAQPQAQPPAEPSAATSAASATEAVAAPTPPPQDIPFQILSYGEASASMDIDIDEEMHGTPVTMGLGSYSDPEEAETVARAFAVLGAVDRSTVDHGEQTVIHLSLSHLRAGVTAQNAYSYAADLGLAAPILY